MAEFDKEVPTNDDDQVAIVGGPESASGGAGAPVPGGALGTTKTHTGNLAAKRLERRKRRSGGPTA